MPTGQNRTPAEMIGEFLRDAAVLVAVFAPLEKIITGQPLTGRTVLTIVGLVVILAGAGVVVEVRRK
jgi:ascorbate-specific PTS system EIIC-type component UlaA